jgi:hypothetical protein
MSLCSGIRADGGRCRAQAITNTDWCFNHHPDYEEARQRRASKGGRRGGRGRPQAELSDIKRRLLELAEDVLSDDEEKRVDKGVAAVASQVLNVYLRAVSVELKAREQLELVERLEALETALERKGDRRAGSRWGA